MHSLVTQIVLSSDIFINHLIKGTTKSLVYESNIQSRRVSLSEIKEDFGRCFDIQR